MPGGAFIEKFVAVFVVQVLLKICWPKIFVMVMLASSLVSVVILQVKFSLVTGLG